jgi:hypothetical protein
MVMGSAEQMAILRDARILDRLRNAFLRMSPA